ncbi:hypothetical protein KIN20_018628 [Parelaphostrongylus tenuis]|uniref:PG2 pseudoGTPase domain-containing protein n=1 Tax=Parelaphostrongylus tenuis TaxID=148309 RepID=A0AAD5QRN1_PARTN|nr:hypothetical protein KIN20_018628 [Parelaphostrongylus tenuis]
MMRPTDFCGSPVINCDHWLYWGERKVNLHDSGNQVTIRVIEQTEFLDDETYEPLAGSSSFVESYTKRCCQIRLESRDKLMYIQKEQLGLEADFKQQALPDGKCTIDAFIFVFDSSKTVGRSFESQCSMSLCILLNVVKTRKPVVVALSQADIADEEARKALQSLLNQKDIKNTHISVVEVSALMNVNVDELFVTTACLALQIKLRPKVLTFPEANTIVVERNIQAKIAFTRMVKALFPLEDWPSERLPWTRPIIERCLDRHPDYCNFMRIYGKAAARKVYETHVNKAREHWMSTRLHALIPNLSRVFAALIGKSDVARLNWSTAYQRIQSHPLFDEYFQPFGHFGENFDPLPFGHANHTSQRAIADSRIPAEILLQYKAQQAFETFKRTTKTEQQKERLEEEFEFLLSDTPQVTPGKPLQDVSIFLQGLPAYESLPPNHAAMVYDRFQHHLVKRAESEFYECMLENIELFVNVVREGREQLINHNLTVCELEMERIKEFLQNDFRFRQLSRLFELRDTLIRRIITLLTHYSPGDCPASSKCAQLVVQDAITSFFHKKKRRSFDASHLIDISVYGEATIVARFIMDMKVLLRNEPFQSNNGPAMIRCHDTNEVTSHKNSKRTLLFLLDSGRSVDYAQKSAEQFPPVYVLVDTCHQHLKAYLHQQGLHLAENTGGIFIGTGSADLDDDLDEAIGHSRMFGRDQLLRICDMVCASQQDGRECLKIQLSLLCGDPFSIERLLTAMFGMENETLRMIYDARQIEAGIIPVDVHFNERQFSIDLHTCAYHSWLTSTSCKSIDGHIVVYSARRPASFAHARSAVSRVLDEECFTLAGKAILIVAVLHNDSNDEGANLQVVEGSELATSVGASFITISPDSHCCVAVELAEFFVRVHKKVSTPSSPNMTCGNDSLRCTSIDQRNDGCFRENSCSMHDSYSRNHSTDTLLSPPVSGEFTLSTKPFKKLISSSPALPIRNSPSVTGIDYSSNVLQTRHQVVQVISPPCLPISSYPPLHSAPAARQILDVSSEYSVVQDALAHDHHIYATFDFCTRTEFSEEEMKLSKNCKKDKKLSLRSEILSCHSSTELSTSLPTSSSQPSSTSSLTSTRRDNTVELEQLLLPEWPREKAGSEPAKTSSIKPPIAPKSTASSLYQRMTCSMPSRSTTMDVTDRESVMKSRHNFTQTDISLSSLRQSLSAESLVDLMGEKKKRFSFVRKVATSLRFKNSLEKERAAEKSINFPSIGCRSSPQSPQMERKGRKSTYLGWRSGNGGFIPCAR